MNLSISLDLGDTPSVLAALANERTAQRVASAAAESYTDDMLDWIRDGHGFTPRTGQLEQSIGWRGLGNGSAEVYANAAYARWVEDGTAAHVILPSQRQALKIPVPGLGYVLRRRVNHPGSRAHPFFFADLDNRQDHAQARALSVLAGIVAHG